jgi:serine/threonine-protein kinase
LLPELAGDDDFVARFRREARAAASLNHPNIVAVYDSGEHEGQYFIVMEFVDGPTLSEMIADDAPLPEARAAEIGMEIAAALGAAHQQGIVHRDVKPGNVLLGSGGTVKVVDFGIARAMASNTDLTRPGTIVGSVAYIAPEQAMGEAVGPATDLYSLGAVLYAMVTSAPPFSADTPVAVAHQHVHQPPVPPSEHNAELSPAFEALVLRLLAKDPADRPASAEDVRQELLDIVEGATAPESTSPEMASPDATSVMTSTQIYDAPPPTSAMGAPAPMRPDPRKKNAALVAIVAVVLAVAVIALIIAVASQVRDKSPEPTTIPTTIPTTTATTRRIIVTTRPATTVTTQAPTTTEVTEPFPTAPTFPTSTPPTT